MKIGSNSAVLRKSRCGIKGLDAGKAHDEEKIHKARPKLSPPPLLRRFCIVIKPAFARFCRRWSRSRLPVSLFVRSPALIPSLEKLRRLAAFAGWAALLAILFSTLSPLGVRPHIPLLGADLERFLAFFAAGATFAFAYPRQRWLVLAGIVALAIGLEWLQTLEKTRHGLPHDAIVKVAGATLGSILSATFDTMAQRFRKPA